MSKLFLAPTRRNTNFKGIAVNTFLFLFVLYFAYHALSGDRGLFAFMKLKNELSTETKALNQLKDNKLALENKVALLNSKSLDLDLLDELARKDLGLIGSEDYLFIENPKKGKSL